MGFSACSRTLEETKVSSECARLSPLISLVESTHIIRTLVTQNKIQDLLEEHDPEQLALLLNNRSPAQLAFEAEVLAANMPLVAVYYYQPGKEQDAVIGHLESLATKYAGQVKFVLVDADKLFSLVEDAAIELLPTLLLVKSREIVHRLEGENSNQKQLEDALVQYL